MSFETPTFAKLFVSGRARIHAIIGAMRQAYTIHTDISTGYIENVPAKVWAYEVSGKQVLTQWFSYRRRTRTRPIIGDRRLPSPLGDIQPSGWLAEYTTELLNVLHVLGRLVACRARRPTQTGRFLLDRRAGIKRLRRAVGGDGVRSSAPQIFRRDHV